MGTQGKQPVIAAVESSRPCRCRRRHPMPVTRGHGRCHRGLPLSRLLATSVALPALLALKSWVTALSEGDQNRPGRQPRGHYLGRGSLSCEDSLQRSGASRLSREEGLRNPPLQAGILKPEATRQRSISWHEPRFSLSGFSMSGVLCYR